MSAWPGRTLAAIEAAGLATVLLPWARLACRRAPLPRVRARLEARLPVRRSAARLGARTIGRIVAGVGRRMPGIGTCLTQALVAEALLRRERHPAQLVIGVERPGDSSLRAHAWVESAGGVVIGTARDLCRYTPIAVGRGPLLTRPQRVEFERSEHV